MKKYHIQGDPKNPIIKKGDFLYDMGAANYGRVTKSFLQKEPMCVELEYYRGINENGEPIFFGNRDTDGEENFVVHIADLMLADAEEAKEMIVEQQKQLEEAKVFGKLCGLSI